MIKRADWQAAYGELVAEGRRQSPTPPTVEELLAFADGELTPEEATRVEEHLALHPEVARILAAPATEPEEGPLGKPGMLSAELLEQDFRALVARIGGQGTPGKRPLHRRRWFDLRSLIAGRPWRWRLATAAAFSAAAALGLISWQERRELLWLNRELVRPRVELEHRVLLPDGVRDAAGAQAPIALGAQSDPYLLSASVAHLPLYPDYRLRIVEMAGPREREIWSAAGLHPRGDAIEILMPRAFLTPGRRQRLEVYGVRGARSELLATYTVELADS